MQSETRFFIIIFGMAIVTALCRMLPVFVLSRRDLTQTWRDFFSVSPVAVMAAIIAPSVFVYRGVFNLSFSNPYFWVSIPTVWVACRTRSIAWTALSGMVLMAAWHHFVSA